MLSGKVLLSADYTRLLQGSTSSKLPEYLRGEGLARAHLRLSQVRRLRPSRRQYLGRQQQSI